VLVRVARRIYHPGVGSERTRSAAHLIAASVPCAKASNAATQRRPRRCARAVPRAHDEPARDRRHRQTLADLGGAAVTPLQGVLHGTGGRPIGTYLTSVWSDEG